MMTAISQSQSTLKIKSFNLYILYKQEIEKIHVFKSLSERMRNKMIYQFGSILALV